MALLQLDAVARQFYVTERDRKHNVTIKVMLAHEPHAGGRPPRGDGAAAAGMAGDPARDGDALVSDWGFDAAALPRCAPPRPPALDAAEARRP